MLMGVSKPSNTASEAKWRADSTQITSKSHPPGDLEAGLAAGWHLRGGSWTEVKIKLQNRTVEREPYKRRLAYRDDRDLPVPR